MPTAHPLFHRTHLVDVARVVAFAGDPQSAGAKWLGGAMWWLPTKQRFALSDDGQHIRANQGHSTTVDLGYEPAEPPEVLFHGMVARLLPSIRDKGLQRMGRHHVHLSPDETTARAVGGRRGKPIILRIDTRAMREAGHVFFVTPNGVWLTDAVPASFISGWGEE